MEIVKSAVKYKDEVFTGYGHEECFIKLFKKYDRDGLNANDIVQGFVTDTGEFVDRVEATALALKENKEYVKNLVYPQPLMTEDLYVYWLHRKDGVIEMLKERIKELEGE